MRLALSGEMGQKSDLSQKEGVMKMSDFDDFRQRHQPAGRKSKLDPYASEIFGLKDEHYTLEQIALYLKEAKQVQVTPQSVYLWLKKNKQKVDSRVDAAHSGASHVAAQREEVRVPMPRPDRPRPVVSTIQSGREDEVRELNEAFGSLGKEPEGPQESLLDQLKKAEGKNSK